MQKSLNRSRHFMGTLNHEGVTDLLDQAHLHIR
jgi:hypothetical protein